MEPADELKELLLRAPRWTLAVAESLTCGHLQARIGAVSGASRYFLGGVTAYTLEQKVQLLGVDRAGAEACNCVGDAVAREMAAGVARQFGAEVTVATTGYAEPDPARGITAPQAWWAIRLQPAGRPAETSSGFLSLPGASRLAAQAGVADAVLRELVARLRAARG